MKVEFDPLQERHFQLLLKWLQAPHVKKWWDTDILWNMDLIKEKYGPYIEGYKLEQGVKKILYGYIIFLNDTEIGYIQLYNAHDFPREDGLTLNDLPKSLAAFDLFIGEEAYIGKKLSTTIMEEFLKNYVDPYFEACFVDPNSANISAIRAYEKVGFQRIKTIKNSEWLVRKRFE